MNWRTGRIRTANMICIRSEKQRRGGKERREGIQKCKEDNERDKTQLFVVESFEDKSFRNKFYAMRDTLFH